MLTVLCMVVLGFQPTVWTLPPLPVLRGLLPSLTGWWLGLLQSPVEGTLTGWRCGAFRKSPVFVGIKVVQYQGSLGVHWDRLISFKKWYLRNSILWKMYSKLCYRITFIQEPFGACVYSCELLAYSMFTHMPCIRLLTNTHVNTALTKS